MSIELLENRIAPAAVFINSKSASFSEPDGDIVTVSFSKPILTPDNLASVLSDGPTPAIDLTGLGKDAKGLNLAHLSGISFSVKKGASGDGFASIASINASGIDLSSISGSKVSLGSLSVGDATVDPTTKVLSDPTPKSPALGALNVRAFGATPGAPLFINPRTATYTDTGGDIVTVSFSKAVLTPGNVASVLVQGADGGLQKLDLTALGKNAAGTSLAQGANVTVAVKKATGDGMAHIGFINAQGIDLGAVSAAKSDLGRILVGDGVDASLNYPWGAPYDYGGIIEPTPKSASIRSLSVASMGTQGLATQGGTGDLVSVFYGEAGTLAIKGDVLDASLEVRRSFARIDIGGSLVGHDQPGQGSIKTEMSSTQKEVDVGDILSERLSGPIRIGGNLTGGSGSETGYISTTTRLGSIRSISIGGDLNGGSGSKSGAILVESEGGIGSFSIKGSVNGGAGFQSGYVYSGDTATLSIGGDIKGGSGNSSGGIEGDGISNRLTVGGNIRGGNITGEGVTLVKSGYIEIGGANVVSIKGSLVAGVNDTATGSAQFNGSVVVLGNTESLSVGGSLLGNVGAGGKVNYVTLNAGASNDNGPFTKIAIGGSATYSRITNGLGSFDNFRGGDPTISKSGSITIGGDFMSSSISIGIGTGADGFFGTADDDLPTAREPESYARIASIIIKGNAAAAPGSGDSSVIQSERIDQLIVKGTKIPLTPGKSNDNTTFSGIKIREITRAVAP